MSSDLMRFAPGLILLSALSFSAWAQENNSPRDDQHLNPLATIHSSDIHAFVERPLFAPTRRPADLTEDTSTEIEKPARSAPEFVLLGVTSGPEGSVARIAKADGKDAHSLQVGELVEGWKVQSIEPSSVKIAQGGQVTVLTIFRGNSEAVDVEGSSESTSGIVFGVEDPADTVDPPKKVRVIEPK